MTLHDLDDDRGGQNVEFHIAESQILSQHRKSDFIASSKTNFIKNMIQSHFVKSQNP